MADSAPAPTTAEHLDPGSAPDTRTERYHALDVVAVAQLWADQFRHLATLGVAGAGGVLILLEAQLMRLEARWWLPLALFTLTAVFAMYGQITVVDDASAGEVPGRKARWLRGLALAALGAAGGAVIGYLLDS